VRISLTVPEKSSLLTVGDRPDLCTAVLWGLVCESDKLSDNRVELRRTFLDVYGRWGCSYQRVCPGNGSDEFRS
jgi:hypothetical protein